MPPKKARKPPPQAIKAKAPAKMKPAPPLPPPPPPQATKSKAPAKKKPALPPPPPPKRRQTAKTSEPIPEWEKGVTTQGERERKRFKLSRAHFDEDIDVDYITRKAKLLVDDSTFTWGVGDSNPIEAIRRRKRRVAPRFNLGRKGFEDAQRDMAASIKPQRRLPIANCLSRTPILRISLEIREMIYSYLLVNPVPIMVKSDWIALEGYPHVSHSLLVVCKQFAFEASSYLCRNNTFQSLIREPRTTLPALRFEPPPNLPLTSHALFRNILIDCSKACWNLDWHGKAAEGLNALAKANPTIHTLTLAVVPQRVEKSDTALGKEARPVTFADFLWYPSPFMKAVRKLAPKIFKVVIKKPGRRRIGITIDSRYLRIGAAGDDLIANEETLRSRELRTESMEVELRWLKERFEDVFEDDKWAIRAGTCVLISAGNEP